MEVDWSLIIAIWGAALSTLLAIPKLYGAWSNRFQIDVSPVFRSDPEMGNELHVRNMSGKPITIEYLELYYREGVWPKRKDRCFWSPEDSLLNARVDAFDSKIFVFSQADHFAWGKGRKVYARLYFVGKKPILRKLGS